MCVCGDLPVNQFNLGNMGRLLQSVLIGFDVNMTPQRDNKIQKIDRPNVICPLQYKINTFIDTMTISTSAFIAIARTGRSITKTVSPRATFPSISLLSHHDDDLYRLSSNTVFRAYTVSPRLAKKAWDPSLDQYKYWNREDSKKGEGASRLP